MFCYAFTKVCKYFQTQSTVVCLQQIKRIISKKIIFRFGCRNRSSKLWDILIAKPSEMDKSHRHTEVTNFLWATLLPGSYITMTVTIFHV